LPSIQAPPLGRLTARPPATKKGTPRPSEKENIESAPIVTFFVVAIHAIMPVRNGPVHGAAMRPMTRPRTNAPRKPTPPTVERRLLRLQGRASSNRPHNQAAR